MACEEAPAQSPPAALPPSTLINQMLVHSAPFLPLESVELEALCT